MRKNCYYYTTRRPFDFLPDLNWPFVLKAVAVIAVVIAGAWFTLPILWGLMVQGFRAIQNTLLAIIAILMAIAGAMSFIFFCCSEDETGAFWAYVAVGLFVVGFVIYRI